MDGVTIIYDEGARRRLRTGHGVTKESAPSIGDAAIGEAVAALLLAPDSESCARIFLAAIAPFGIDTFASGEVDLDLRERNVFYAIAWPDDWRKFYLASGFVERDPVVEALGRYREPFTWAQLRRDRAISAAGGEALQIFADHGWTDGLVVPIPRGDKRFGLVSLVCRRRSLGIAEKPLLTMLSLCFHERLRNLAPTHGFAVPPLGLTRREIDCLTLVARGMTDSEIGRRLKISQPTAHGYLEIAKRKLRAPTRARAVALAVALAIIAP